MEGELLSEEIILKLFSSNLEKSIEIIPWLESKGYIERNVIRGFWTLSLQGKLLISKRYVREFNPITQKKHLAVFLKRVELINTSSKYPLKVSSVKIRSKYPIEEYSNGINLIFSLERKEISDDDFNKAREKLINESKKGINRAIDWIYFPHLAIYDFLKSGSHILKLRECSLQEIVNLSGFFIFGGC